MTERQSVHNQDPLAFDPNESQSFSAATASQTVVGGNVNTGGGDFIGRDKNVFLEDAAYTVAGLANPYLGLSAFTYAERTLYAGRTDTLAHAVHQLTDAGGERVLLFVTGASGSGKSSFVLGGLLPALENRYAELKRSVRWAVIRPSKNPLAGLAQALSTLGLPAEGVFAPAASFLSGLPTQPGAAGQVSLLVVDQFEELFTQSVPDQREEFLAVLAALPTFSDLQIHIVATLRADYLPDLFKYKAVYEVAKGGIDLRVMTTDELKQAIREPPMGTYPSSGKRFEDALLTRLAEDAAGNAAYLPLLQVTLVELWNGGQLKLSRYEGLHTAIQKRADRVLKMGYDVDRRAVDRTEAEQQEIMALLLDLVEVAPDGAPQRALRRRRRMDALLVGRSVERRRLIDELSDRRLLATDSEWDPDTQCDVQVVDLIHEALVANWPRLRDEIVAQRSELQRRLRFELALNDWKAAGKNDQYLLQSRQLKEAKDLNQSGDVALRVGEGADLFARSIAEENRRLRRQRRLALAIGAALVVLTLAALGAAAIAFDRQQQAQAAQATAQAEATRADQARATAVAESRRARAGELAALATTETENDPERGILLALEAISTTHTVQAENALRSALMADHLLVSLPHSATVTALVFSPDGKRLVTADNRLLRIWDTTSHQRLETWSNHDASTIRIAYQPQGTQIATADANSDGKGKVVDVAIHLWNPNKGEILRTLTGHTDLIYGLAYNADGTRLASASLDGTARIWDVRTGEAISLPVGSPVLDVAFSSDGLNLATANYSGAVQLWDVASGRMITTVYQSPHPMYAVAFSPDGSQLAAAGTDQIVRLWRLNDANRPALRLVGHTNTILDLAFRADGKRLVSAGAEGTAIIWDVSDLDAGAPIVERLSAHQRQWVVQFDPSGTLVATGEADNAVRIWSAAGHDKLINALSFGPAADGLLATAGLDNTARVWRFTDGNLSLVQTLAHDGVVRKAVFSPDGKVVATASGDHNGRLWDARTGQLLHSLIGHTGEVKSIAFSPDGRLVATASDDQTAKIWNAASGELQQTLVGQQGGMNDIAFSPDGAKVATVSNLASNSAPAQLRLWSLANGNSTVLATDSSDLERLAFSPDGTRLAFAGAGRVVNLLDIMTGRTVYTLTAHTDRIYGLVFDETGTRLATTGNDGRVLLWDVEAGKLLQELPHHESGVTGVGFSPGDKYLVTADSKGFVNVQALATKDLEQQALHRLTRWWKTPECEQLLQTACPSPPAGGLP
jgi:WD40 repeat protein